MAALREKCRARGIRFDMRPKVLTQLVDSYYEPGSRLDGRCLYPFNWARVSFSGKVYFCPFIRVEVGDLTKQTLEEVWNGDRVCRLAQKTARGRALPGVPPLLQSGALAAARRRTKQKASRARAAGHSAHCRPLTRFHG